MNEHVYYNTPPYWLELAMEILGTAEIRAVNHLNSLFMDKLNLILDVTIIRTFLKTGKINSLLLCSPNTDMCYLRSQ